MKYNFDTPTNRRNTGSLKWDVKEHELPMWVADMDFETAPEVKEELIKTAEHGIFGYSVTPDEYFSSLADFWEKRHGYRPNPSMMVYCSGVVAAISSMVRKLTTPAEKVLIQPPVYNIFYNCIQNNGRVVLENQLKCERGIYSMDFEDLEKKLSDPQTTLMILCNPHNPVGNVWDKDTLARVGALCKKYGVTVISDEIHCALTMPGTNYVPFASVNDVCSEISVSCFAASKTFNLAGLQAAAVYAENPLLRHKVWRGINTDEVGEPNVFSMNATIAAYRFGGEWLDALREYLFENKRYAVDFIKNSLPMLKTELSEGGYFLWVDVSEFSENSRSFADDLRQKTGLYVSSGTSYGPGGEHYIRINLATQRENVIRGMKMLESYVGMLEKNI